MALQNVVEHLSFSKRKEKDVFARTLMDTWKVFEPTWNRWSSLLDMIIEDKGGDRLVERRRGELFRAPPKTPRIL